MRGYVRRRVVAEHDVPPVACLAQAEAIDAGALPACEFIYLQGNQFDAVGKKLLKAATKPKGIRVHFGGRPPLPGVEYE